MPSSLSAPFVHSISSRGTNAGVASILCLGRGKHNHLRMDEFSQSSNGTRRVAHSMAALHRRQQPAQVQGLQPGSRLVEVEPSRLTRRRLATQSTPGRQGHPPNKQTMDGAQLKRATAPFSSPDNPMVTTETTLQHHRMFCPLMLSSLFLPASLLSRALTKRGPRQWQPSPA